jgi:mannan endo-1,4-beta-mannosidase
MRHGLMSTALIAVCVVASAHAMTACSSHADCMDLQTPLDELSEKCLRFGVSTPGGPLDVGEVSAVAELVGVRPSIQLSFHDFASIPPIGQLGAVDAAGAASVLTWEPWRHVGGEEYDPGAFPMGAIAAGAYDDYLYRWADELAAHEAPVYLRFAHEPNGTWYPWSPAGGTTPEMYIAAWRHVHDLFLSKNATNVKWVWAPNVPVPGEQRPLVNWYPGDGYVDVFGIDGYNWGTTIPGGTWTSPSEVFDSGLRQLRDIDSNIPIVVTEVGSAEAGGDKPAWIGELVEYLDEQSGVTGFVWFDHDKEADWRLNSSEQTGSAMARALEKVGLR